MQKVKKIFISLVIFCLASLLIPFNVSAEEATYYPYDPNSGCLQIVQSGSYYTYVDFTDEVRAVRNDQVIFFVWVDNNIRSFYQSSNLDNFACSVPNYAGSSSSYDNVTFYYVQIGYRSSDTFLIDIPHYSTNDLQGASKAYRLTWGDLSVDPTPEINYGELIVGFHTNFSASGTTNNYTITSNTNLDTIEWENIDANGNDLQNKGLNVEIRAVPILYTANSKSALDLLGFQDAVVDSNNGLILWQGNFNDNHKSFIWNDVINQLQTSNPAFAITSLLTGSVWTRYGWIYQIRYNDVLNGYSSEWQTIYNSTSIKVSDSEKIVNQYYYHYPSGVGSDDQDIFHDINTVNNTTNNWYVNDVPIDTDASWLDSLIQAIAEIIGKILDFFSSIFDGLVDLILGLFGDVNPADSFFNWFSNLFNGIGDIDLTLPQFNLPNADLTSFNRLIQETLDIFSLNNFGFVIFIPLLLIIIKAVF